MRTLEAVTAGYGLARNTTRKQAESLGRIIKVRVGQPVAGRVQVGRRAFVAFRFGSTQRTAWYAEAKRNEKQGQGKGEAAVTKVPKDQRRVPLKMRLLQATEVAGLKEMKCPRLRQAGPPGQSGRGLYE
eukprot:6178939-Pleurochrysis_carterae.AAC.2